MMNRDEIISILVQSARQAQLTDQSEMAKFGVSSHLTDLPIVPTQVRSLFDRTDWPTLTDILREFGSNSGLATP